MSEFICFFTVGGDGQRLRLGRWDIWIVDIWIIDIWIVGTLRVDIFIDIFIDIFMVDIWIDILTVDHFSAAHLTVDDLTYHQSEVLLWMNREH